MVRAAHGTVEQLARSYRTCRAPGSYCACRAGQPSTDRAGGTGVLRRRQEDPGRWRALRKDCAGSFGPAGPPEHRRGAPGQCAMIVTRPRQNRERHAVHDLPPASPARQLFENVRTRNPDECDSGESAVQQTQGVHRKPGPESFLDRARDNPPSIVNSPRGREARGKRGHTPLRFQWVARRDHQPDLAKAKSPPRQFRHMAVPFMGGIERAAQEADATAPTVTEARDGVRRKRVRTHRLQG
jgi:hypothetical protein